MDRQEQFDFLKNYYELLKNKNANNIGERFLAQAKQLASLGEIDRSVLKIVIGCIEVGQEMHTDLSSEDLDTIKDFIEMGIEMKEEKIAGTLAKTITDNAKASSFKNSSPDPCSRGYSGRSSISSRSGC